MSLAIKWYQKAASQNVKEAQYSLGMIYLKGTGVSVDYQRAADLLRKAGD